MNANNDKPEPGGGVDPAPLMRLSTAYWEAQTFLTANRMGLFALLADGPKRAEDIANSLRTHVRPTRLLLNACVALGLLETEGARYSNSALSATYLLPGKPSYLGNAFRYSDNLYETWGRLERALREGGPPMAPEQYLGRDPVRTRHFVYGMHDRAQGIGRALVALVDLEGRRRMLDVGGGPGTYSILFCRRYPELRARVLDLPEVTAIAEEIIADMGAGERVSTLAGDYRSTPFPPGNDVVLISGVFHRETEATCRDLIARARQCLDAGGTLIVSDVFTDAAGTSPAFAALFGLNMMLTAPDGGVHADVDAAAWLAEAGFGDVDARRFPPPMPHRFIIGRKR